jgi:integrase
MVGLKRESNASYSARKRLPDDVRDEYGRLYGPRLEAKFYASASTEPQVAKQRFNEWLAEVESRIAAIRAKRDGVGRSLTRIEARKLAGEWYEWFTDRRSETSLEDFEWRRDQVNDAFKSAGVSEADFERLGTDELWRTAPRVREAVRPVIADMAETAQFLAAKRVTLSPEARDEFLDYLYSDLAAALKLLIRRAEGDYSDDEYQKRFPKVEQGTHKGIKPYELFKKWIEERKPARGTIESWRYVFQAMQDHFVGRSAASITPDEARAWIKALVTSKRSAQTVRRTWLNASKTVYRWAFDEKLISKNVFSDIKVTVPRNGNLRAEGKSFTEDEQRTILRASLAIKDTSTPFAAAQRWVPWLCAYTGARPGEITQLRAEDVFARNGVRALKITPAAGTVKGGKAREVPLHGDLIEQGFLDFVLHRGPEPLFYKPAVEKNHDTEVDITKPKKSRAAQVRQRLADWVRSLGVADRGISPLHAWRHTFKQIGARVGIERQMLDYIEGHAPVNVGAGYGTPTLSDMAEALKRFPRYEV